jgi:endonuclease/exonuclease/phosphatase family metal-dependent hydrolase
MKTPRARWFARPTTLLPALALGSCILAVLLPVLALALGGCKKDAEQLPPPGADRANPAAPGGPATYLFCSWNVENFFDDRADKHHAGVDKEYDTWFAENPDILKLKLKKLTDALLKMNDGKGPDLLAVVEVESVRAAELLQEALNAGLPDPALHYQHVLMREVKVGRHIAPAILSRLPLAPGKALDKKLRILEARVTVNDHKLVVIASHWTSRLGRKVGGKPAGAKQRAHYANEIYGRVRAMWTANPRVDVLVCGDFNDTPDDPSVTEHLRATGDKEEVLRAEGGLRLLNLMAGKDPNRFGTIYHGRWFIFDQLVVTPGMLDDQGWSCVPGSVQTVRSLTNRNGRPWSFGGPRFGGERGYSDHLPVTVQLKVAAR